jgi:Na+/H+ antiporter NhaD/arsenite permease-like protein
MIVAVRTGVSFSAFVSHFFQGSMVFTHVFPVITRFFRPLFSIWWKKTGEKRLLSGDDGFYRVM